MSSARIMNAIVSKVKAVLSKGEELLDGPVTPERTEKMNQLLGEAATALWQECLQMWLQTAESDASIIRRDGKTYRYKLDSEKEFLTPAGMIRLTRRVYQPDAGGPCYVPLDAAWGMEDQFATIEVRDAVLYAAALITPEEVENLLIKSALFHPSATAIKRMANDMGQWLEEHEDQVLEEVRAVEPIPKEARVLCASLDGANVLLSEPGKKKGRPNERPHEDASRERMSPTCYKNAMVGSVTLYGEIPRGKKSPKRLVSRYAARMPEDRAPTLKAKFERELQATESRLDENVARIMLCDGAPGLWNYIDHHPAYTDYEKLVDYHHTTEHLSKAAEALFGKGSQKAVDWYDKYCSKLKGEDGAVKQVLYSMDYYERAGRLCRSRRAMLDTERTFFIRNKHRMEYARFRRNGWPIGSGPVEAACKSLVKTRLCRSGMRWSRVGGQHILSLRTYVKSGRWDTMWYEYKRIERLRSFCNTT